MGVTAALRDVHRAPVAGRLENSLLSPDRSEKVADVALAMLRIVAARLCIGRVNNVQSL